MGILRQVKFIYLLPVLVLATQPNNRQPIYRQQGIEATSVTSTMTQLRYVLPDFQLGTVQLEAGTFQRIVLPQSGQRRELGAPDIPVVTVLVAVPAQGQVNVTYTAEAEEELNNINLAPVIAEQLENQIAPAAQGPDPELYRRNAWFPEEVVKLGDRIQMRDLTVVPVTISPFQYNPHTHELRAIRELSVEVTTEEPLTPPSRPISRFFEPLYQALVPNYALVANGNYQKPCYLFIEPDNFGVVGLVNNLVTWKREKGFEVHVATTSQTGTTTSSIKNYIQSAYDNWPNPPEFICLVGDAQGTYSLPTWTESWSGYSGEGDHPYTHLAGQDYIADAFIGRLSFQTTTQLATIISKILNYEKTPYLDDPTWFTRALLVGDPSITGQSTVTTNQFIDEASANVGFTNNITVYSGSFVSQMANGLNQGVSFFNYRGWLGMSNWGNSNTNALNNGFKLPFVTLITCGTGSFRSESAARSEAFLRAGTPTVPKGGIAAVGTATSGTHTSYNNCVDGGIYQGIFNEGLYYAGQALARGWINLNLSFPDDEHNYVEIFSHWNNLMGDPGLELWTGVPQSLTVFAPDTVPRTVHWLAVQVQDAFGGPIAQAWVSLLQDSDSVAVSGFTDEQGFVELPLDIRGTAPLLLTVTSHNAVPVQRQVVVADGAFLPSLGAALVVDDNGDGLLNPGESAQVSFMVYNAGDTTVNNLTVELGAAAGGDTVSQNFTFTAVPAGDSIQVGPITITLPPDYPGMGEVDFSFRFVGTGFVWEDHQHLPVYAPAIALEDLAEQGQDPPSFDPGETANLIIYALNLGRTGTSGLTAILRSHHEYLEILDSTAVFSDGAPQEALDNQNSPFQVAISTQTTVGLQLPLELIFTDNSGFIQHLFFNLPIGTPTQSDPLGPDAYGYFCYDSGDSAYALAPVYDWVEISPSLGGSGILVPLSDYGDNQEDIETVTLPFTFGFYGQNYNEISIGSNGYIAFGTSSQATFRNWRLPGALGPSPMVAAFWDDLKLGGNAGVYTYFDAIDHRFIIEFDRMINRFDGSLETFEIILYDPLYYSQTGDGDILIQYKTFNNVDAGNGWASSYGNYATIGIENQTGTVGLEYTFNNTYPVTAMPLGDETAIFFTTRVDTILPCPGWMKGDMNHDGGRNIQDLVLLINTILGRNPVGECEYWSADVSSDSSLDVSDVVQMVRTILGLGMARATSSYEVPKLRWFQGTLYMDHTDGVAGFQVDVKTEAQIVWPAIKPGLEVTHAKIQGGYRVLGYWTSNHSGSIPLLTTGRNYTPLERFIVVDSEGRRLVSKLPVLPQAFQLTSVAPNPFNPVVNFTLDVPNGGVVTLEIYNPLGQMVYQQEHSVNQPGRYVVQWAGIDNQRRRVASGLYLARLGFDGHSRWTKVSLLW